MSAEGEDIGREIAGFVKREDNNNNHNSNGSTKSLLIPRRYRTMTLPK